MSFHNLFSEREREILRLRADRAAQAAQDTLEVEASLDVLMVAIGDEVYALPLNMLTAAYQSDVNLATPVVPIPCVPAFVAGVTNIRGHVIPVLDLAILLGLPGDGTLATALVIVANANMSVALSVVEIGDAASIRMEDVTPVPETLHLTRPDYLQGTLPDGAGLLNVNAILNDPALIVDETTA